MLFCSLVLGTAAAAPKPLTPDEYSVETQRDAGRPAGNGQSDLADDPGHSVKSAYPRAIASLPASTSASVLDIGSRLELFVDEWLIAEMSGVTRKLHSPQPKDIALRFDSPWDGACSLYVTLFQDDDKYRMYYRGLPVQFPLEGMSRKDFWQTALKTIMGKAVTCYAESADGIHWKKPDLGLFTDASTGRKDTNIVLRRGSKWPNATDNLVVFKDANPDASPEARYKAVGRHFLGHYHVGNLAFQSSDGIHWKLIQEKPLYEDRGHVFDAQNVVFWDPIRELYVEYHRKFRKEPGHPMHGLRDVSTSTSEDFLNWSEPQHLEYGGAAGEHFNHLLPLPYSRAPHIYVAFADRLVETRDDFRNHPADGISDIVFLSSRDGINFDRSFMEAWVRPGLDVKNWMHAGTSPAWGLLRTGPEELSVYWIQNYYQHDSTCYLQRGTLRLDGFVSIHAPYARGEFTTKPLRFKGGELVINFSTSAVGSVRAAIEDADGGAIEGFGIEQCDEIYGDRIEQTVTWKGTGDVSQFAGSPVRLRFVMRDADLYSIRFR